MAAQSSDVEEIVRAQYTHYNGQRSMYGGDFVRLHPNACHAGKSGHHSTGTQSSKASNPPGGVGNPHVTCDAMVNSVLQSNVRRLTHGVVGTEPASPRGGAARARAGASHTVGAPYGGKEVRRRVEDRELGHQGEDKHG